MRHDEWCRLWTEDKDLLEELFWVYQSGIRHVSKRFLFLFSPFLPLKILMLLYFSFLQAAAVFTDLYLQEEPLKISRVTINNYEKLLQIYISELLNLTGSLGQLSELTLLCCSGCGCVPGTAHQHFLYDPPLRPWLCFLPCHRSNLCCLPCSGGVLLSQQWFAPDTEMDLRWLMRESFNRLICCHPCSNQNQ